jgi:intracellular multiplication protein IcmJ
LVRQRVWAVSLEQQIFNLKINNCKNIVHTLKLNANVEGWRVFTARKADPAFQAFSKKVLRRDNYTCRFCGFQARDYQEIVNFDQNYHNNKLSNLVTACCFCAQCFFLESVGIGGYGGGTLICLPEISQAQLNSFCHVLFCAIANDTEYKNTAQNVYRSFKLRSQLVDEQLGEGTSNPAVLGQLLLESDAKQQIDTDLILKDLRLLPSRAGFKTQIERWAATALHELAADGTKSD